MRRPLFFVCLCLTAIAALRLWLCDPFSESRGESGTFALLEGETVTATGRVCQKDTRTFTLDSVVLDFNAGQSDHISIYSKDADQNSFLSSQSEAALINFNQLDQESILTNRSEAVLNNPNQSDNNFMISEGLFSRDRGGFPGRLQCEYDGESGEVRLGSIVTVRGRFRQFQSASNPGEFDVAKYYRTIGIRGKLTCTEVLFRGEDYFRRREWLYQQKCRFQKRLLSVFPKKEASILIAMLLGDKGNLDDGVKELYQENGIIHILSISGLHITIIGMGLYRLLRRMGLPAGAAAPLGCIVLGGYGVMTGMGVSACRAIGMYVIRMLGGLTGRTYDMLTALGVMAVLLAWSNPFYLLHAGFLLSFGSILGIGVLYPALDFFFGKNKLLRSVLAGSSITLFTLPIQLWFYYEIPTYSVLLNLLVLPFVGGVMTTGLITMLVPGTGIIGTVTCLILQGYELLCRLFEKLPFHMWNPGQPKVWQIAGYYLMLLTVCVLAEVRRGGTIGKRKTGGAFSAFCLICGAVLLLAVWRRTESRITFLDVGQGDGIVVETEAGGVYLFDCGSSSRQRVGEFVLFPYLKSRGIRRIDGVFVSHADKDHLSGVEELLIGAEKEGIAVKRLVLPRIAEELCRDQFAKLLECAGEIPVSYIQAGESFQEKGASFLCLHPPAGYRAGDANVCSECFYVQFYGGKKRKELFSLLLTGDVEEEGEELLLDELQIRGIKSVTMLKVAHHGSGNSTGEAFLETLQPRTAVISSGRKNPYGHPHRETVERLRACGAEIFGTAEKGAVTVHITEKRVTVDSFYREG